MNEIFRLQFIHKILTFGNYVFETVSPIYYVGELYNIAYAKVSLKYYRLILS